MKRIISMLVCCLVFVGLHAQRITHEYDDVSLSEALRQLNEETEEYTISFLYNELEDFRITTSVHRKTVPDAIRQMIGFYPIRMTVEPGIANPRQQEIIVECPQKTAPRYKGTVIDEQGQPVAYANIALLSPQDSTLITGGVSNESGFFVIPCEASPVLARISFVGYKTIYKLCETTEIGVIRIKPDTYTLKNVVVKGEIPQYQMTAEGMTVHIAGTLLAKMGTATDVLGQLPRVTTTPDGSVSVYGKGTPLIYINNRQVRDNRELTQLKSDDIKSIDIISSPGAKYDGSTECVIRISTIKRRGEGFSLETESNLYSNSHLNGYEDLTAKYSTDRLEVSVNGFYRHSWRGEDNHFGQSLYGEDTTTSIRQNLMTRMRHDMLYGETSLNYDINDSISLGVTYDVYGTFNSKAGGEGPQEILRDGQLTGTLLQQQDIYNSSGPDQDLNVYFTGKAGRISIDFNGTAIWRREKRNDVTYERQSTLGERDVHTNMLQRNRMQAAKLVLTYPILKGELSLGTETTHTQTQGQYTNEEGYASNSETNIRENNTALFTEYKHPFGNFELRAGLRYEHVNSCYYAYDVLQEDLSRRYDQWLPNASLSWSKGKWGARLDYNKRTLRPSYWALRNFLQYDNRYQFEGGNPQLRPQVKHTVGLDARYSWLSLQLSYFYLKDAILWTSVLDRDQNVSVLSNRNFDHYQSVYASLSASPKFGFYQPTWDISCRRAFFDVSQYGSRLGNYKPDWTFALKNRFAISKTCTATLNINYQTREYAEFIISKPQFSMAASIAKSFFSEALTVRLYVSDIFKTYREQWTMYGQGVDLYKDCYNYTRRVGLIVNYNLNPSRSKYKGTGAGNDEKNRL